MSLKRTAMARKPPLRPAVADRSAEFASFKAVKPAAVMARNIGAEPPVTVPPRIEGRADWKIRNSARGEACTVRIIGACTHDPASTIWSHAPLGAAGKGRGLKAIDLAGAYCCVACDAVVDGQRRLPDGASRDSVLLDWFHGHMRSLVRLKQKGLA